MSGAGARKKGYWLYASLVRSVMRRPSTSADVAQANGIGDTVAAGLLRRWSAQGVVHIAGWRQNVRRGQEHEVWAFGPGKDAPVPANLRGTPRRRVPPKALPFRSQAFNFGLLMKALEDGHASMSVVELLGLNRSTIDELLGFMHDIGLTHICDWYREPGRFGVPSAVYRLGNRPDKPRPEPVPRTVVAQRSRAARAQREAGRRLTHLMAAPLATHA